MNTLQHTTDKLPALLNSPGPKKIRAHRFTWLHSLGMGAALLWANASAQTVTIKSSPTSEIPQAVVLSVKGKCSFSEDGTNFSEFKAGHVFNEGAVVRTDENARTDLFFRRIGTTVRLQPGTDVKLEKMTRHMTNGVSTMETLLDLRTGRIFTVVRSLVPGSTLEIRNAAGRSVVEGGGGKGRYIITADGTHVTDKDSVVPLKVIGETGITIITPGQRFNAKEGKMFRLEASSAVADFIDLDEIQSLGEQLTATAANTTEDASEAVVLSVGDHSTYDKKGDGFEKLRVGQVLAQGAVIRSGADSDVDLFLRRWGTTIRLMPGTELALEKMTRYTGDNVATLETHLDLREGRIFCFIRIPVPDSTFEVKTKAGRSTLKSAGAGRYDIRANGTIVAGQSSFKQVLVTTEHGVIVITPGQKFDPEKGQTTPAAPSEVEMMMIQMDQLVALADQLTSEELRAREGVAAK